MIEKVQIGNATLYCGDCADILPELPQFDLLLTDPPYGISVDAIMQKQGGTQYGKAAAAKNYYESSGWDESPVSDNLLHALIRMVEFSIIFGGNYYRMEPSSCWLVWDKENGTNGFADCELAWTNLPKAVRRIKYMWNGMLRANGEARGDHPTQKPIGVMAWCLSHVPEPFSTVLDPFMGSGTTGVACAQAGKEFTGIERERKYFDIACKRIEAAQAQGKLFAPEIVKPVQESML